MPKTITRERQLPDVIYALSDDTMAFVSPDGIGRYYYDSIQEAKDEHGELPVVKVERIDW